MPLGNLEVLLVNAKGLDNSDFLSSMDPYVLLTCRTQEKKSSVSTDTGSNPEWNETFIFAVTGDVSELHLRIMDKDTFSADDCVGEAKYVPLDFVDIHPRIPLEPVFEEGSLPPTSYTVVKDGEFKGEIKVGLTFVKERGYARGYNAEDAEEVGGWKESSF